MVRAIAAAVLVFCAGCGDGSGSGGSSGEATPLLKDSDFEEAGFAVASNTESNAICEWGTGAHHHKLTWSAAGKSLSFEACGTKKAVTRTLTDDESAELKTLALGLVVVDSVCDVNDPLAAENYLHLTIRGVAYEKARRAEGVWYCPEKNKGSSYVGDKEPASGKIGFFDKHDEYVAEFKKTLDDCFKDSACKSGTFTALR